MKVEQAFTIKFKAQILDQKLPFDDDDIKYDQNYIKQILMNKQGDDKREFYESFQKFKTATTINSDIDKQGGYN